MQLPLQLLRVSFFIFNLPSPSINALPTSPSFASSSPPPISIMAPPNDASPPSHKPNAFHLSDSKLTVKGAPFLSENPPNVTFTPFSSLRPSAPPPLLRRAQSTAHRGGFLGFRAPHPSDTHLNSLGKFERINFLSIFRFKTWWSTQWVGNSGSDLQMETQFVLLDLTEIQSYVLIVPLIQGRFRSALQPGRDGHVMIWVESGSIQVKESSFESIAYVHVSSNPYTIMKEALTSIRVFLDTFKLLEEKSTPPILDKFGWCTWDAFYLTVNPVGIYRGVDEFYKGGIALRLLIIDDGWQSINRDEDDPSCDSMGLVLPGEQAKARLFRLDEGERFRNYRLGSLEVDALSYDPARPKMLILKALELKHVVKEGRASEGEVLRMRRELDELIGEVAPSNRACNGDMEMGMKAFIRDLRGKFTELDDIYVWHALCGAWGGVRPNATHLRSKIVPCCPSLGLSGTMDDDGGGKILEAGVGLVDPKQADELYDSMHSYLASVGINGVKLDVIHTLEYVAREYGGRVELAKRYYEGLSKSLKKNFNGSSLISSMQQCNDFFFLGTKHISMGRVGDDFWFQDPNGDPEGVFWLQGVHMIHCAYNSLWMGEIIYPDWDMFQSDHVCAKFHAASRAICGGSVCVSDSLGEHDFHLLKKLVYPDGTVPRCQKFALPTRDCLFKNPLFDQKTLLKLWNFNKYGGVVGAFNCQGAGWDPKERRFKGYKHCYKAIEGTFGVKDIEWDQSTESPLYADEYAVYRCEAETLLVMGPDSDPIHIILNPSSFELFTLAPIKKLTGAIRFAPIGLRTMLNSGGTLCGLEYEEGMVGGLRVVMKVKGEGRFLAYSDHSPEKCLVNGEEVGFEWLDGSRVELSVPWFELAGGVSDVVVRF